MKTLFSDAEGIPQFINAMEASQQKSKQEKLVMHDEYMHAVALKLLLQSGEYETDTRVVKTTGQPSNLDSVEGNFT